MSDNDAAKIGNAIKKVAHAEDIESLRAGRKADDKEAAVPNLTPWVSDSRRDAAQAKAQGAVDRLRSAGMTPDKQMRTHLDDQGLYPKIRRKP